MNTERPVITIVTREGSNKDKIFRDALPGWHIHRKDPSFYEAPIESAAPKGQERTVFISREKARTDMELVGALIGSADMLAGEADIRHIGKGELFLYNDTEQFIHDQDGNLTIHDKPEGDPVEWAKHSPDAMAQSGKTIEIVTALTGILKTEEGIGEPQTVIVRVEASMRPFTRDELVKYAETENGRRVITETAGGISLANGGRSFYDTTKPLTVSVQEGLDAEPQELLHYSTWTHVPDAALKPFICGAFEPAVVRLVEKTRFSSK